VAERKRGKRVGNYLLVEINLKRRVFYMFDILDKYSISCKKRYDSAHYGDFCGSPRKL